MKQLTILVAMLLMSTTAFTQSKKMKDIEIKSSIQCGMCVDRLTNMFENYWAVKEVKFNVEEQKIFVNYNSKKTSPEQIRKKISETGYDADSLEANIEAYMALPECCKKGAHIPEEKEEH